MQAREVLTCVVRGNMTIKKWYDYMVIFYNSAQSVLVMIEDTYRSSKAHQCAMCCEKLSRSIASSTFGGATTAGLTSRICA